MYMSIKFTHIPLRIFHSMGLLRIVAVSSHSSSVCTIFAMEIRVTHEDGGVRLIGVVMTWNDLVNRCNPAIIYSCIVVYI